MTSLLPNTGGTGRPEPVLDAAKIAAAVSGTVTAIGTAFVLVGWFTTEQVQSWAVITGGIVTAIGTLVSVVMPVITALGARAQVTPLAAPVSVEGVPLVTSAAAAALPTRVLVDGRTEITDSLRDLEREDAFLNSAWPETRPTRVVGPWTPATPAAAAAEPTPIEAEAAAATTGRIPPVSTPTT